MTKLSPIPSAPRAPQARISLPLILALALIFMLAAGVAIPESAGAVEPLTVSVSLDKTTVAVGETVTATWAVSGGTGPYQVIYQWVVISAGATIYPKTGTAAAGVNSSSFSPALGETCSIFLVVTDSAGRSVNGGSGKIPVYVYATGITLDRYASTMDIGGMMPLTATITPSSGTIKTVSWSSNDSSVATVNSSGLVTAVGEGEATITASALTGS